MRRECREHFPRHRLQRKPRVSDPGMHYGTCVTHVPWCMSGSLARSGRGNVSGIPRACATRNFTYLVRGPYSWPRRMHLRAARIFNNWWVRTRLARLTHSGPIWRQRSWSPLAQVMVRYSQWDPEDETSVKFETKYHDFRLSAVNESIEKVYFLFLLRYVSIIACNVKMWSMLE